MQYLHGQVEESDKLIVRIAGDLEPCRRLVAIPGIGPITATATLAAIGNGAAFKKGRGFAFLIDTTGTATLRLGAEKTGAQMWRRAPVFIGCSGCVWSRQSGRYAYSIS